MSNVYDAAFKIIIGHEGGYQNIYNDRGNWTTGVIGSGVNKGTKYGISAMSYPNLDIKNLTLAQAEDIYKNNYWNAIQADTLSPALALVAFDTAVNSGVGRAREFLLATHDVTTFLNLRRQFLKNLKLYNQLPTGGRRTYGQIWDERVDSLEAQATQFALVYPVNAPTPSPQPQEGHSSSAQQQVILLDVGQGFTALTERYEDDRIVVNPTDEKIYIRLK